MPACAPTGGTGRKVPWLAVAAVAALSGLIATSRRWVGRMDPAAEASVVEPADEGDAFAAEAAGSVGHKCQTAEVSVE